MPILSEQQAKILRRLKREEQNPVWADPVWGVPWRSGAMNPKEQASRSRSLALLERRGFVVRQNRTVGPLRESADDPAPKRTTHVVLTEAGREAV